MQVIKNKDGYFYQATLENRHGKLCHIFTDRTDKACEFPSYTDAENFISYVLSGEEFGSAKGFTIEDKESSWDYKVTATRQAELDGEPAVEIDVINL